MARPAGKVGLSANVTLAIALAFFSAVPCSVSVDNRREPIAAVVDVTWVWASVLQTSPAGVGRLLRFRRPVPQE